MLAQAAEAVPGPAALRAGVAYEQKLDGHRALLFTAAGPGGTEVVQTRRGALAPGPVAGPGGGRRGAVAARPGPRWRTGRLGRRGRPVVVRGVAAQGRYPSPRRPGLGRPVAWPAYFVAFDLLQQDGQELLARPYAERRALLENLFAERALTAPWTSCPMTTDLAEAREWLQSWTTCPVSMAS
ncbi:hypothetical protein [Streptomyces sp. NPDC059979]|uniref:ATP-dependent DNA ligase n=1 Tax=Streptomyces sp. NPDC059979 TaxID=3347021 RepID=UPI0036A9E4BA